MLKNENSISEGVTTLSWKEAFVWPLSDSEMAAVQIFVLKSLERKKGDEWQTSYDSNLSVLNETIVAAILTSREEVQMMQNDDAHNFLKSLNDNIIGEWPLPRNPCDPILLEILPKIPNAHLIFSTNSSLPLPIEVKINFLGVSGPYSPQIGFIVGLFFVSFLLTKVIAFN
jgi:hypothetical protein